MAIKISKKCDYALRAVLELALRSTSKPVTVQEIASEQDIPPRFLEIILNELRQAGLVTSHRGNAGGYTLAELPKRITVAQVVEAMEGPISMGAVAADQKQRRRHSRGVLALDDLWTQVNESMTRICEDTSFEDLVDREKRIEHSRVMDYSI